MNVEAAFRPLSDLEKSMADLYAQWAGVFDADREAAFLWVKMANEELRLLSCLGSEDRGHLDRLKKFATARNIEIAAPQ